MNMEHKGSSGAGRVSFVIGVVTGIIVIVIFIFGLGFNWAKVSELEIDTFDHENRLRKIEGQVSQLMIKLTSVEEKISFLYDQKIKEIDELARKNMFKSRPTQ